MTDRLTPQERQEIRARAEAATPGPWFEINEDNQEHQIWDRHAWGEGLDPIAILDAHCGQTENAEFISNARTDVPRLLTDLDAAGKENETMFQDLCRARKFGDDTAHLMSAAIETREKVKDALRKQISHTLRARKQRDRLTAENARLRAELKAITKQINRVRSCKMCAHHKSDVFENPCAVCNMIVKQNFEWARPCAANTPAQGEMGGGEG